MAVAPKHMTLEQFLALPEERPALEFIEGGVTQKAAAKGSHGTLQPEIAARINAIAVPRRLARAYSELRATYGDASTVPDVSVYRWDRIPTKPNGTVAEDFIELPDIAIEIVSPGQQVNALVRRSLWYVANGVAIALLIDPDDRSVLAFRRGREAEAWRGSDRIDLSDVLSDFDLTVEGLFASLEIR